MNWQTELDEHGCALMQPLLTPEQCREISGLYDEVERFRSTIDMARYRFGSGQYRYFDHPLPTVVAELRQSLYPQLLPIARDWAERLGRPAPWPDTLEEWLDDCHRAGQTKPTLIFTTRDRPVKSARGWSAAPMRHGVSTVRSGLRHTLGLVFHDAA